MVEKLKKYLPEFISSGELLDSIIQTLADIFNEFSNAVVELKESYWTGKGLKLQQKEFGLDSDVADEAGVQAKFNAYMDVMKARGTTNGITEDVEYILGNGDMELKGIGSCGVIVGVTHPGIDDFAFLDAKKVLILNGYSHAKDFRNFIQRAIVPIDVKVIV